jgi:hypothetical protein
MAGDLPIDTIAKLGAEQIDKGFTLWQKWSCTHCGSRQTMEEPNILYRSGECQACGRISPIVVCGFMIAGGAAVDFLEQMVRDA